MIILENRKLFHIFVLSNRANMDSIKNYIGILILMLILALAFGGFVLLALAIVGALIVPLTYVWGLITDQSYDRVCDNSEIVFKLNQIGKWTLLISVGMLIMWLVF
jgi:hypothetical protein